MDTRPFGMILFTGYALLIGVEDYSAHDPAQSLLAGRNDVLACWKLCRTLGYQIRQIRVLTTPALELSELLAAERQFDPGANEVDIGVALADVVRAEATRSNIEEGARWLAEQLESAERPVGFLSYSGHGARLADDLALCPSDLRRLEDALGFAELRSILDGNGPRAAENLTVLLDCCFAGMTGDEAQSGGALRPLGLGAKDGAPKGAKAEIGCRVFGGCGREERAYQAKLGGRWHGAFTWAFTVALEQWKTVQEGNFKRSTIGHAELLSRAVRLLEALSFPQTPVLVTKGIDDLAVFDPDGVWRDGDTSDDPTAARPGVQLDPSSGHGCAYYRMTDAAGGLLAEVLSANTDDSNGSGFKARTEYWRINGTSFQSSRRAISVSRRVYTWGQALPSTLAQASQASFCCSVDPSWTTAPARDDSTYQTFTMPDGSIAGFDASVSYDSTQRAWVGQIRWAKASRSTVFAIDGDATLDTMNGSYTISVVSPGSVPIVSGQLYTFVLVSGGTSSLTAPSSDEARWSSVGGEAGVEKHQLVALDENNNKIRKQLADGDEVYIGYDDSHFITAPGCWNLAYNSSTRGDERYYVVKANGGKGLIRTGELVRFRNERQTSYNSNKDRNGNPLPMYLSAESDNKLGHRQSDDSSYKNLGTVWTLLACLP